MSLIIAKLVARPSAVESTAPVALSQRVEEHATRSGRHPVADDVAGFNTQPEAGRDAATHVEPPQDEQDDPAPLDQADAGRDVALQHSPPVVARPASGTADTPSPFLQAVLRPDQPAPRNARLGRVTHAPAPQGLSHTIPAPAPAPGTVPAPASRTPPALPHQAPMPSGMPVTQPGRPLQPVKGEAKVPARFNAPSVTESAASTLKQASPRLPTAIAPSGSLRSGPAAGPGTGAPLTAPGQPIPPAAPSAAAERHARVGIDSLPVAAPVAGIPDPLATPASGGESLLEASRGEANVVTRAIARAVQQVEQQQAAFAARAAVGTQATVMFPSWGVGQSVTVRLDSGRLQLRPSTSRVENALSSSAAPDAGMLEVTVERSDEAAGDDERKRRQHERHGA